MYVINPTIHCYFCLNSVIFPRDFKTKEKDTFCMYLYLPYSVLLSCLCVEPDFYLVSFFHQPKRLPLTFLVLQVCWWWILQIFLCLKKNIFAFTLKIYFLLVLNSRLSFRFVFSTLCLLAFFSWDIFCHSYPCSSVLQHAQVSFFPPAAFKLFLSHTYFK